MEELLLTTRERAAPAHRAYDGYYPSLHLTYNATDRLLLRAAYAKTYGRPDFDSVIPNSVITEFDDVNGNPSAIGGTITIRNPALRPWTADNYDLSVEYYTDQGGVLSGGIFRKEIENFFGDVVKAATLADLAELGLDSQYEGWTLTTKFNSGSARITGGEVNLRQSLLALGGFWRHFDCFANATKLRLEGGRDADFSGFMPLTLNWGVGFCRGLVTLMANWNHRGEQPLDPYPAAGDGGYTYWKARTTMDLYAAYQVGKRLSLYAAARNVLNVRPTFLRYSADTPDYARVNRTENYGVKISVGVKGSL